MKKSHTFWVCAAALALMAGCGNEKPGNQKGSGTGPKDTAAPVKKGEPEKKADAGKADAGKMDAPKADAGKEADMRKLAVLMKAGMEAEESAKPEDKAKVEGIEKEIDGIIARLTGLDKQKDSEKFEAEGMKLIKDAAKKYDPELLKKVEELEKSKKEEKPGSKGDEAPAPKGGEAKE
jgi:uncharacterized protein involved in copper resistance